MLISRKRPGLLDGIAEADSVTLDPHKWFYAPLDAGAILVADESRLTKSFGMKPAYLTDELDRLNATAAFAPVLAIASSPDASMRSTLAAALSPRRNLKTLTRIGCECMA